ncbi:MAG TPA: thioredoxin domain-containing protein [Vicinamibacteria bacterium]|jgi:protein-disulfide isomerase
MKLRAVLAVVAPLALAACSRPGGSAAPGPSSASKPATGTGVVAEVNGGPILASELEQRVGSRLTRLKQEEYEIRRQVLDEMIGERLVAAQAQKSGLSAEALLQREVDAKVKLPSETEIRGIYEQNKFRFGSAPRDEAIAKIREILSERAVSERRAAYEKELRSAARVAVRLEPPRAAVAIPAGAPATGPGTAKVTIVEFTDYQCPYCHRAQSVIDEVLQRYSGKVRFVHLDYPLEGHAEAVPAARAARCAGEQGKFWEYHRSLMARPGSLDPADLKGRAATLELDGGRFSSCLASTKFDEAIQSELRHGSELGVTGTPAYFVNGRLLSGARPVESFVEVIEDELAGQ